MEKHKKNIPGLFTRGIFVLFFIFLYSTGTANPVKQKTDQCITSFENGRINWSTGKIFATGKAAPVDNKEESQEPVLGSARADANRKIIEILKKIRINTTISAEEYSSKNDTILAGIEKTARDAVISKQYYTSALSVEVTIETSMFGGFLQLVLPEEIRQISGINPETNPEVIRGENRSIGKDLYTGLIIDVRGLEVEPVLNPVIISEQGHEVYSSVFISREFAVQYGVSRYFCNMDQALKDARIGRNPLVLKGLRMEGKQNIAIVISTSDYQLLEKTTERHTFLKECRVIILMDQ